jgi:hypothetical protein
MSQRQLVSRGEVSKTQKSFKDKPFFDIKNKKDFIYELFIYFICLFYLIGVEASFYVFFGCWFQSFVIVFFFSAINTILLHKCVFILKVNYF